MNDESDSEKIFFYKEMKDSFINYNSLIKSLIEENENITNYYKRIGYIYKNVMDIENNEFLEVLLDKIRHHDHLISLIDDFLKDICQHEIIEDYIEGGVEKEMIKIKYCKNCEITF